MSINDQIAALQEELRGLDQDKTFADIDRAFYHSEHQRISKAISKLREDQPSNFYSPEPTPEQAKLKRLKNQISRIMDPFRNRVASKWWMEQQWRLRDCPDASAVRALYRDWQTYFRLKNITLPDLNPGQQTQISNAA